MRKCNLANPDGSDTADSPSCFLPCPLTWLRGASAFALVIPSGPLCKALPPLCKPQRSLARAGLFLVTIVFYS